MQRPKPFSDIKAALGAALSREAEATATLESEHRLIEGVLEQIEALADELPDLPPRATIETIVIQLRHGLPAHCRHEEEALAEIIEPTVRSALILLRREHIDNDAIAAELADAMDECVASGRAERPEALGQLARQYFMLMRRHMAWEEFIAESLFSPSTD